MCLRVILVWGYRALLGLPDLRVASPPCSWKGQDLKTLMIQMLSGVLLGLLAPQVPQEPHLRTSSPDHQGDTERRVNLDFL